VDIAVVLITLEATIKSHRSTDLCCMMLVIGLYDCLKQLAFSSRVSAMRDWMQNIGTKKTFVSQSSRRLGVWNCIW